jgi:hypothetical protein
MIRWYWYLASFVTILLVALGVRHVFAERAQQRREVEYQKTLRTYSEVLGNGFTRKQVEDYLSANNVAFQRMCCISVKVSRGVEDNAYDDLVRIGQDEHVPWYCSKRSVYIAFQFLGSKKESSLSADPSDRLQDVTIYHMLNGCL